LHVASLETAWVAACETDESQSVTTEVLDLDDLMHLIA